jgi:hypothetical protein
MTAKPILSQSEKNQFKYLVDCTEIWLDPIYEEIESLIRAHVVKALDGIELPKEMEYTSTILHNFVDAHNKAISEVKQAIQKAKEAYL